MGCQISKEKLNPLIIDSISMFELLKGNYSENLPLKNLSEIRIFISSTFSDYKDERNYIIKHVYNKLREKYYNDYGIDLIFIDMRWGVTEEVTERNQSTTICLNEIEICQKESIGPSFVLLLGNRYGTRMMLPVIAFKEYQLIKSKCEFPSELDLCYELDKNYINEEDYCYKLRKQTEIKEKLGRVSLDMVLNSMRHSAKQNYTNEELTLEQMKQYFISITDQEVRFGILSLDKKEANKKSLVFFREAINNEEEDSEEEKKLMTELKNDVKNNITEIISYQVNRENKVAMEEYLKKFEFDFIEKMNKLVKENYENYISFRKQQQSINNEINLKFTEEIINHYELRNRLIKNFFKRDYILNKVNYYLNDDNNNHPLFLTGESGSGKSSIIANISKTVKNDENIVIIRFMGTSRDSSNIKSIMISLIQQFNIIFNLKMPPQKGDDNIETKNIKDLKIAFNEYLKMLSEKTTKKIIILLDSIDQLNQRDHSLDWMNYDLPKNIKIIYSVLSLKDKIMNILQNEESTNGNMIKVEPLDFNEAKDMLNCYFEKSKRKLTDEQFERVNECLGLSTYPLHVKLLFDISINWTSEYKVDDDFRKCKTIKETIKYLIRELEKLRDVELVSKCLFYLTVFRFNGISESELEDLLSIDEDLLTKVFKHHNPPIRRFQNALWIRLKYDLRNYLIQKECDEKIVISWYHLAFIEATEEYYEDLFKCSLEKDGILKNILDYFTEKYNENRSDGTIGVKKRFLFVKKNVRIEGEEYRETKSQKMEFMHLNVLKYNIRKLNIFPQTILMLNSNDRKLYYLRWHVYFNYDFMHAAARLRKMNFLIDMHEYVCQFDKTNNEVKELIQASNIYIRNYLKIQEDPDLLMFILLSQLESRSECVLRFAEQSYKHRMLIPIESFKEIQNNREIHRTRNKQKIKNMHLSMNEPYIGVEMAGNELEVVSHETTKSIGCVSLVNGTRFVKIWLNENHDFKIADESFVFDNLNYFNGLVYVATLNELYAVEFDGIKSKMAEYRNEIKGIFLIGVDKLIIVFDNSFQILEIDATNVKIIQTVTNSDNIIKKFKVSLPMNEIFTKSQLEAIETIFIAVDWNDSVIIYSLNVNNNLKLEQINQILKNPNSGSIIIKFDMSICSITMQNVSYSIIPIFNLNNKLSSRLVIIEDEIIKVVNVFNRNDCRINEFSFDSLNIKKYKFEGIYKNCLIFKLSKKHCFWDIFVYNLEKNIQFKKEGIVADRLFLGHSNDLLLIENSIKDKILLTINKIENDKISELKLPNDFFVDGLNNSRFDFNFKNEKFYHIQSSNENVIDEFDLNFIYNTKKTGLEVVKIEAILDSENIFIRQKVKNSKDLINFAIYNIPRHEILCYLNLNTPNGKIHTFYSSEDCLIYADKISNQMFVYKIKKHNTSNFEFAHLLTEQLKIKLPVDSIESINRCFADDNIFWITMFNDRSEFMVYKLDIDSTNGITAKKIYEIKLVNILITGCLINSTRKHIIFWEQNKNIIHYYAFSNNENNVIQAKDVLIHKLFTTANKTIQDIHPIKNSDNFLVKSENIMSIYKPNTLTNKILCKMKNINDAQWFVGEKYLCLFHKNMIEIHQLEDVLNNSKTSLYFKVDIKDAIECVFSIDSKFIYLPTKNKSFYLIDCEKKVIFENLSIDESIRCLKATKEYVIVQYGINLICFSINKKRFI